MTERPGLGGSDVPALFGVGHRTALDVWRGIVLHQDVAETPAMRAGKRFEAPLLAAYAKQTGAEVLPGEQKVDEFRRYTTDGFAELDGWRIVLEGKTTAMPHLWGPDESDTIPAAPAIQGQWYLDGFGLERCDFPVLGWPRQHDMRDLIGLEPVEIIAILGIQVRTLYFAPEVASKLRQRADRFWHENILAKVPPAPVDLDDAKRLVRCAAGLSAPATEMVRKAIRDLAYFRGERKRLEQEAERAEFLLREAAREAGYCEAFVDERGDPVATLKVVKRAGYTVKPTEFQQIRLTKESP